MSKGKFNLFSRSALASMAAAAGIVVPAADSGERDDDEDGNPEAGPKPTVAPASDDGQEAIEGAAPEAGAAPDGDAGLEVVAVSDALAIGQEQFAAGVTAERQRTAAVFASAAGLANPAMAAFMLAESSASADAIIAKLGTLPAASASVQTIPDTNIDLGKPGAAAAAVSEGSEPDDVWAQAQGKDAAPVAASDAGRMSVAALQAGAPQVKVAPIPSTPAVPPTGN